MNSKIAKLEEGVNIKTLEGQVEVLCDTLEDIGVFDLVKGASLTHGTYPNTFTATEEEMGQVEDSDDTTVKLTTIPCNFEEAGVTATLKLVQMIDEDGDRIDFEVYWIDEEGSQTPR